MGMGYNRETVDYFTGYVFLMLQEQVLGVSGFRIKRFIMINSANEEYKPVIQLERHWFSLGKVAILKNID